jgi:hypothetical protein
VLICGLATRPPVCASLHALFGGWVWIAEEGDLVESLMLGCLGSGTASELALGGVDQRGDKPCTLLGEAVHCVFSKAAHKPTCVMFHGPSASLTCAQRYCDHV